MCPALDRRTALVHACHATHLLLRLPHHISTATSPSLHCDEHVLSPIPTHANLTALTDTSTPAARCRPSNSRRPPHPIAVPASNPHPPLQPQPARQNQSRAASSSNSASPLRLLLRSPVSRLEMPGPKAQRQAEGQRSPKLAAAEGERSAPPTMTYRRLQSDPSRPLLVARSPSNRPRRRSRGPIRSQPARAG